MTNDKMTKWQNDKMTKWQNDKMTKWQNDKITHCKLISDKMPHRLDVYSTKWPSVSNKWSEMCGGPYE